jgi:hypothetical protein
LYAGGDLEGPEAATVDRILDGCALSGVHSQPLMHLQECAGCRQFYEGLESNHTLLRSLRRETVTPASLSQMRVGLFSQLQDPAAVLGWRIRLERLLLTGFRKPRYAVAGLAMAVILSVALFAQMRHVAAGPVVMAAVFEGPEGENTLMRPEYQNWKVVDATTHDEYHAFGKAYISPNAYKEFSRTGKFPEGTVMVLESPGPNVSFLASVKDSSRFEDGWGYFEFRDVEGRQTSKASALPSTAGCVACHRDRAALDQVFTQFYPVLRTASGVL